jgi:hypothetical protein
MQGTWGLWLARPHDRSRVFERLVFPVERIGPLRQAGAEGSRTPDLQAHFPIGPTPEVSRLGPIAFQRADWVFLQPVSQARAGG